MLLTKSTRLAELIVHSDLQLQPRRVQRWPGEVQPLPYCSLSILSGALSRRQSRAACAITWLRQAASASLDPGVGEQL